jgi:hypothetical protein
MPSDSDIETAKRSEFLHMLCWTIYPNVFAILEVLGIVYKEGTYNITKLKEKKVLNGRTGVEISCKCLHLSFTVFSPARVFASSTVTLEGSSMIIEITNAAEDEDLTMEEFLTEHDDDFLDALRDKGKQYNSSVLK